MNPRTALPCSLLSALALAAAACDAHGRESSTTSPSPAPRPAQANASTEFTLGKTAWAGCVATVRGALGKLPGVARVDIEVGRETFTVHYDSAKVTPEQIVASLHQAGEKGVQVKA